MSDTISCSDSNGNFCDGVEHGPLNESIEEHNDLNISSNDLPDISLQDISSNDLRSTASDLELSINELAPETPEKNGKSLLNLSSDFLPAESPERKHSCWKKYQYMFWIHIMLM